MLASPGALTATEPCITDEIIEKAIDDIVDICGCSHYIELGETETTSFLSQYHLGALIENECIKVFGDLLVDYYVHFRNNDFIMGEGSRIVIKTPEARMQGNQFQTCGDYMWKGIGIINGNELIFESNIIMDATQAINSDQSPTVVEFQSASIHAFNNIFHRNIDAISFGKNETQTFPNSYVVLLGNIFSGSENLKSNSNGIPNDLSAAVILKNSVLIADASSNPCELRNVFYQVRYGLSLFNCISTIKANIFKNFHETSGSDPYGILAQPMRGGFSQLVVEGFEPDKYTTSYTIPSFDRVQYPILSFNSTVEVSHVYITNAVKGISVTNPFSQCKLERNFIQAGEHGIVVNSANIPNLEISRNYITVNSSGHNNDLGIGIELNNAIPSINPGLVDCNVVTISRGRYGILLNNQEAVTARANHIYMLGRGTDIPVAGLALYGGRANSLLGNQIEGPNLFPNDFLETDGITISNSTQNLLESNRLDLTDIGLMFSGDNFDTRQENNRFSDHRIGYFFTETAITGDQVHTGNRWIGSYSDFAALHWGNHDESRHVVYTNQANSIYDPDPKLPSEDWFDFDDIGSYGLLTIYSCTEGTGDGPQIVEGEHTLMDLRIIEDSVVIDHFEGDRRWNAKRYLTRKLLSNPQLLTGNQILSDFLDTAVYNSYGQYALMEHQLAGASATPDSVSENLADLDSLTHLILMELTDTLLVWMINPEPGPQLNWIRNAFSEADSMINLYSSTFQHWYQLSLAEVKNLLEDAGELPIPNTYAVGMADAWAGLSLALESPDSLSGQLLSDLEDLATACPVKYGPGVYMASAVLGQKGIHLYTLEVDCMEPDGGRRAVLDSNMPQEVLIYPNPTGDYVWIEFIEEHSVPNQIKLFNAEGKWMKTFEVGTYDHRLKIDLGPFGNGTYFLTWPGLNGNISHQLILH
ncbi:MAG: T9SS C-terminal target domain-containing protein [Saprospirales bacterium]|nr:MAG: T9SS C-terminal target domain-containing protein [Saprospirales bacterium]